jgi:hypothetical protein
MDEDDLNKYFEHIDNVSMEKFNRQQEQENLEKPITTPVSLRPIRMD